MGRLALQLDELWNGEVCVFLMSSVRRWAGHFGDYVYVNQDAVASGRLSSRGSTSLKDSGISSQHRINTGPNNLEK